MMLVICEVHGVNCKHYFEKTVHMHIMYIIYSSAATCISESFQRCADVWIFFSTFNSIVNVFGSSPKRHFELKSIKEAKIIDLIASRELEIDIRANQICLLQ